MQKKPWIISSLTAPLYNKPAPPTCTHFARNYPSSIASQEEHIAILTNISRTLCFKLHTIRLGHINKKNHKTTALAKLKTSENILQDRNPGASSKGRDVNTKEKKKRYRVASAFLYFNVLKI